MWSSPQTSVWPHLLSLPSSFTRLQLYWPPCLSQTHHSGLRSHGSSPEILFLPTWAKTAILTLTHFPPWSLHHLPYHTVVCCIIYLKLSLPRCPLPGTIILFTTESPAPGICRFSRHLLNEWMICSSEKCEVFLNWACLGRLYLSIERFILMAIVPFFKQSRAQSNNSQATDQTATLEGQSHLSQSLTGTAARAPLSSFLVGLTIWDLKLVFNILILRLWEIGLWRD